MQCATILASFMRKLIVDQISVPILIAYLVPMSGGGPGGIVLDSTRYAIQWALGRFLRFIVSRFVF